MKRQKKLKSIRDEIEMLWEEIDEIDRQPAFALRPEGLREKANILLELATLKEKQENL